MKPFILLCLLALSGPARAAQLILSAGLSGTFYLQTPDAPLNTSALTSSNDTKVVFAFVPQAHLPQGTTITGAEFRLDLAAPVPGGQLDPTSQSLFGIRGPWSASATWNTFENPAPYLSDATLTESPTQLTFSGSTLVAEIQRAVDGQFFRFLMSGLIPQVRRRDHQPVEFLGGQLVIDYIPVPEPAVGSQLVAATLVCALLRLRRCPESREGSQPSLRESRRPRSPRRSPAFGVSS